MDWGGIVVEIAMIGGALFWLAVFLIVLCLRRTMRRRTFSAVSWSVGSVTVLACMTALLFGRLVYQDLWLDEPLALAAWTGDEAEVERLLRSGAGPNGSFDSTSAIDLAKRGKHERIVTVPRRAGARE